MLLALIIVTIFVTGGKDYTKLPKDTTTKEERKDVKSADKDFMTATFLKTDKKSEKKSAKKKSKREELYQNAYKLYVPVAEKNYENIKLIYRTGVCAMHIGKKEEAIKYIGHAIDIAHDSVIDIDKDEIYFELGMYYQMTEQYDSAIVYYNHYLSGNPKKFDAHHQKGATEGIKECLPLVCK